MSGRGNIQNRLWETAKKVRDLLLSHRSREFLIFLFFVFVSFCFWLLQVLNDDYETEFSVPLRLKNLPGDVVLTSEPPDELRIGVKDRGTVLANYMLGRTFYPVTIDYEDYANGGSQVRIPVSTLTKKISSQLNQSTRLLAVRPDTVTYVCVKGKAKKVPVRLHGETGLDRQYYVCDIACSPDSVTVYAPQEILDTITAAYTQPLSLKNATDTVRRRVTLAKVPGAKFTPTWSDVTIQVDMYSEKTVEVPVRGIDFPADKVLRTFPSKVQVTFQVGLSRFKSVTADDFLVGVPYETILADRKEKCELQLKSAPRYAKHVRISPKEVDYLIEQQAKYND